MPDKKNYKTILHYCIELDIFISSCGQNKDKISAGDVSAAVQMYLNSPKLRNVEQKYQNIPKQNSASEPQES
jgi:hypothetical protein